MQSLKTLLVAVALAVAWPAAALGAPPVNDTPEGATALELGVPVTVDTTQATAGHGDSGGHSVWFKLTIPGPDGIYRVDLAGSDFDTTLGFVSGLFHGQDRSLPIGHYDEAHPAVHEARELYLYGGGRTTLLWVDGVDPRDVGKAQIVVSRQGSPAGRFATPAPLELAFGPAVAGISRALADRALEAGEPGSPSEQASLWWRLVAPTTGPIALDTCLSDMTGSGGVLRVLTDESLPEATVLATSVGGPSGCPRVEFVATAGAAYRVQSTVTRFHPEVAALRARASGTPPAVTFGAWSCAEQGCQIDVEALPAPGTTLSVVECRVNTAPWRPCTPTARNHWSLGFPFAYGEHPLAARALDSSGRQSLTKTRVSFVPPAGIGTPLWEPSPATTPRPFSKRPPTRLRAPVARFRVHRRGTRVRSLTFPWLPRGATVVVRCRGPRCTFTRRTRKQRRSGRMRLAALFADRMLTPGTTIRVTVSAGARTPDTTRWRIRAGRPPQRTNS